MRPLIDDAPLALDIECAAWDRFLVGCLGDLHGPHLVTRDPDELARAVLASERTVWAHAGGRYDFVWLIDRLARLGADAQITISGSSIVSARFGRTVVRDSLRAAGPGMPLKTFAELGRYPKTELALPCVCGRRCGGYCSLSPTMPEEYWRVVADYLVQDVRALSSALVGLRDRAATVGIDVRTTAGGTGWATARDALDLPAARYSRPVYRYVREALYGGRCECYRMTADRIWRYDRHSSYPAALDAAELPTGDPEPLVGDAAASALRAGRPGVYDCEVYVPEMRYPPLPWRTQAGRLSFPTGRFAGRWCLPELVAAEERGARILRVRHGYAWHAVERIFAGWPQAIYAHRVSDSRKAWRKWLKNVPNSLVGKFAQDPAGRAYALADAPRYVCDAGVPEGKCRHAPGAPDERCPGWEHVGGRVWAGSRYWRLAPYSHVAWSVWTLAIARLELLRQLEHAGDSAVYCATDSCYSTAPQSRRIGDALGEWGLEGEGISWQCPAPGAYSYLGPDGVRRGAAKGIAHDLSDDAWASYLRGEPIQISSGVSTLLSAARASGRDGGPLFRRAPLERRRHERPGWIGARVLLADGTTRAPTVHEILRAGL